jgi:hypothetical protein
MNSKKLALLGCVASLLTVGQASAVNLLTNGGFENPAIGSGSYQILSTIPGWKATSGDGIEIQHRVAGEPQEGNQHVELDSNNNSSMASDAFLTSPGAAYLLTFWYSDRPGVSADSNGIYGYAGDAPFTIPGGQGANDTVWTKYEIPFVGTGADDIEFFASGLSDSLGGYIDNVSVAPRSNVPEGGASLVLLGAVMGGLSMVRRRL